MQKAKRRTQTITKIVHVPTYPQNGNGVHKDDTWKVGDPFEKHPLFSSIGSHKDDPYWEDHVALMKKLREEELERDLRVLDEAEAEAQQLCMF